VLAVVITVATKLVKYLSFLFLRTFFVAFFDSDKISSLGSDFH
jgi:hypothetical protein